MRYEFTLVTDAADLDDLPIDALYEAGCDDGSPCSGVGVAYLMFHRDAPTLADAIATATRDVTTAFQAAGLPWRVVRVASIDFDPAHPDESGVLNWAQVA